MKAVRNVRTGTKI